MGFLHSSKKATEQVSAPKFVTMKALHGFTHHIAQPDSKTALCGYEGIALTHENTRADIVASLPNQNDGWHWCVKCLNTL